ncbi:MAG: lipopolysaccharide biosynthesis protein [Sphingomonadaceae bacterium]
MSIKANFAKSGAWMVAGAIFNNLSSMIIFIALARLLSPVEFGIVAFATIFIEFSRVIVIAGIPDALIQRTDWDDFVASSAFWMNIAISVAICFAIGVVAAPLSYFGYDETFALVLVALSFALVIEALTTVHTAKLRRDFRYKAIATRNMVANVLGGVIGVVLAATGWGVWALVVSRLLSALLTSAILWQTSGWRPRLFFRWGHIRALSATSSHLLGNQLIGQANSQIAGLVIGTAIGPAALAQFRVGTRILTLLSQLLITPLQAAAMSAFSRLGENGKSIAPAYIRVTRSCSLLACPMFLGASAVAPDLVQFLFGSKWHDAGTIMAISGLVVGPAVIMYFFTPALASAGRSGLSFRHFIVALFVNLGVAAAAIPFGLIAIAAGKTIESHLTLPYGLRLLRKGIDLRVMETVKAVGPAYLASLAMGAALMILSLFWLQDISSFYRLVIMVPLGAVLYFVLLGMFARSYLSSNIEELRSLIRPRRIAVTESGNTP